MKEIGQVLWFSEIFMQGCLHRDRKTDNWVYIVIEDLLMLPQKQESFWLLRENNSTLSLPASASFMVDMH